MSAQASGGGTRRERNSADLGATGESVVRGFLSRKEAPEPRHVEPELLVRALDDDLAAPEMAAIQAHISSCECCRTEYLKFRAASDRIDTALAAFTPEAVSATREILSRRVAERVPIVVVAARSSAWRQVGWGLAMAASLTIAVSLAPKWMAEMNRVNATGEPAASVTSSFEVDGETFVALPYSDPDLPVNSSHIVQMQVPVLSLEDAGVVFQPVSAQVLDPDSSVLADVLVGMDGQPLGVHVIGND